MFIIKADHAIHADLFTLGVCVCVCDACIFVVENKVFIHKVIACCSDELTFLFLCMLAYSSGPNDQKQNDKLNFTEAHKMKYEGLKRFVKRECITSFAFFALQLLYFFRSYTVARSPTRMSNFRYGCTKNGNETTIKQKKLHIQIPSNTHTHTLTYVYRAGGWVEIIKSICFALLCFALVTHQIQTSSVKSGYNRKYFHAYRHIMEF